MNYNYLRYFSVLAQVEHYTLAAARLGISQPSLSSAIHHLESELGGVQLFEKVGRNIRLTDEGRYFHEKVDAALQELQTASMTLRDSKSVAPVIIRLGVISGTLGGIVAQEIADYIRQNDRIRFHIIESSAEDLMDLVRQEKLDMAIVDSTNRDRSLHFRKLGQQSLYAAVSSNSPLAACETLPVMYGPYDCTTLNAEDTAEISIKFPPKILCAIFSTYIITSKDLKVENGITYIPIYMTSFI